MKLTAICTTHKYVCTRNAKGYRSLATEKLTSKQKFSFYTQIFCEELGCPLSEVILYRVYMRVLPSNLLGGLPSFGVSFIGGCTLDIVSSTQLFFYFAGKSFLSFTNGSRPTLRTSAPPPSRVAPPPLLLTTPPPLSRPSSPSSCSHMT